MSFEAKLTAETRQLLQDAGWFPARRVSTVAPKDHPAEPILAALSGLRVGRAGRGETCASSDIAFFLLDLEPDDDDIHAWSRLLGTALVGLGEVQNAHGELWMASDGRCFGRSLVHKAFYFEGEDFAEAIERLTKGRRARPLIHPDEESVTLYGDRYTRDHPDVYDFTRRSR